MNGALTVCFFLSGATSLVLQVAWAKELSYVLGNSLYAVSTVVAAFMAGLALGSHLAGRHLANLRRPILAYAGLQVGIAALGAASIPVFRATHPLFLALYGALAPTPGAYLALRFALVFVLMVAPVTLMGMTLPLVAGYAARVRGRLHVEAGRLYGINTVGAVAGTLAAGFVLIPRLGLLHTCLTVAAVDLGVAIAAYALQRALPAAPTGPDRDPGAGDRARRRARFGRHSAAAALYGLSGGVAITLELAWFRYLSYVFGPTADAFSVMLGMYLTGVGIGSLAGARLARRAASATLATAGLQLMLGLLVLLGSAVFNVLPDWYAAAYWRLPAEAPALAQCAVAALLVLPPTLVMGALLPMVVRCVVELSPHPMPAERSIGWLYALNTVGGIAGSLLTGFWLLPALGLWNLLLVACASSLLLGIAYLAIDRVDTAPRKLAIAAGAMVCAVAGVSIVPEPDVLAYNRGRYLSLYNESTLGGRPETAGRVLFHREGRNSSVAVTANEGRRSNLMLRVSGKHVAYTQAASQTHLAFLGHLPVMFAKHPRRVAVIGFGAGIATAALLADPDVEHVDVIELEAGVIEAAPYFAVNNDDALADPRVRVHIADGRTFVDTATLPYDVITTDPISPIVAGASNLYTTDYFSLASRRLAPDGIFCQWLESGIPSEATYRSLLASIQSVFPHVAVFHARDDTVVLAAHRPIRMPWEEFRARFQRPSVRRQFSRIAIERPEQLLSFALAEGDGVRRFAATAERLNSDDHNWLERQMPVDLRSSFGVDVAEVLRAEFGPTAARTMFALVPGLPGEALVDAIVDPRQPRLGWPRPLLTESLGRELTRRGELALAARLRDEARALVGAPSRDDQYESLTRDLDAARERGDRAAVEALLQELHTYPLQGGWYVFGVGLAELLMDRGALSEALAVVRQVKPRSPANPRAFLVEAELLRRLGRSQEARATLDQGLLLSPGDPRLRQLRRRLRSPRLPALEDPQ